MNRSAIFIPTLREVPSDAVIVSHQLMFRAGLIRKLANGLFVYLPLGLRVFRNIERIIREEMDAIGALEIKPPVVVPGSLWKESGRWETMGEGMLRAKNRLDMDLVISPTAEEAVTACVRDELYSYKQLPLTFYQINTKYRDEIRPRYGVMRGREFTMKDAYSFHSTEESLDEMYRAMGNAYRQIFKRCGLTVIPVSADSGAMGGSGSEEFMVESDVGDNTLILCPACTYAANVEKASCQSDSAPASSTPLLPPLIVDTPHIHTIEELCHFLNIKAQQCIKTLIYQAINVEYDLSGIHYGLPLKKRRLNTDSPFVYPEVFFAVCIRGDLEVNTVKLCSLLKAQEVKLASDSMVEQLTGAPVGFAGPLGLKQIPIIADYSVTGLTDAVTGALAADKHYCHVAYSRDVNPWLVADVRTVVAGDRCPLCGASLYEKKGNELGHIFKLGYKYTRSMHVHFLNEHGTEQTPLMGCYGIGVDRSLASIIEEHHDEDGIVWPLAIAPFHVIIIPIPYEGAVKTLSICYAETLEKAGIDVLIDDRAERPGVKFKDADLIGIPYRLVIGEKTLPSVELKHRNKKECILLSSDPAQLIAIIRSECAFKKTVERP
ncbi:Proline--tRNA ligase [Pillotina sp. SPG140]|jgi:prolyl-tRNA synthetase